MVALNLYTRHGSALINRPLRTADPSTLAPVKPFVGVLEAALAKLPFRAGAVERGVFQYPLDRLRRRLRDAAEHGDAAVLNDLQFFSASLTPGYASYYDVQFLVESKRGRYVAPWSNHAAEAEVLFPTDSLFEILDIVEAGSVTRVHLREVD